MDTKNLLILAAGLGSRYGGNKQREIVGKENATIMDYSIYDAIHSGFNKITFIIRQDFAENFQDEMKFKWADKVDLFFAYQEIQDIPVVFLDQALKRQKPWGTAHALICANRYLSEPFAVINADDLYGRKAFELASNKLSSGLNSNEAVGILYYLNQTLSMHGAVNRGICNVNKMGLIQQITETFNITKNADNIVDAEGKELVGSMPVSMNFWLFHPALVHLLSEDFAIFLEQYDAMDKNTEFLLPSCLNQYIQNQNLLVRASMVNSEWFGITYKEDLPNLSNHIAQLSANGHYPISIFS